ncbi:MAG: polysaccharide deacetylase family protein [Anaerolineales bacterium]|nr:polysaccharide deacetylase family protein [Anaerolineales bacterium]
MKRALTSTMQGLARLIPLRMYPNLVRRSSLDVFYHAVSDEPLPHIRHLYPVVPVAEFEAALQYLQERYTFISYAQLHAHRLQGQPLPKKAVHLSFDDGFALCYQVVRPLLLQYKIPCTFFLTTDWIDNRKMFYRNKASLAIQRLSELEKEQLTSLLARLRVELGQAFTSRAELVNWLKGLRNPDEPAIEAVCQALDVDWRAFLAREQPYLTTAQVRQLQRDGFTIGAHTQTHTKLMDLPAERVEAELAGSCARVAEICGAPVVPFSFPHSAWGLNRGLLAGIRASHPEIGLLFDTKGLRQDEAFMVNRVWAERPLTAAGRLHSLAAVLQADYQDAWVDDRWRGLRRLAGR